MLLTRDISILAYITNHQLQMSVIAEKPPVSKALIRFSLRFALGDTAYRFCQMQTSPHHHEITQNSVTALKSRVLCLFIPPPPQLPAPTDLFYLFNFACAGSSLLCAVFLELWCSGFSLQWLLWLQAHAPGHAGFSGCSSQALGLGLSSRGTWV